MIRSGENGWDGQEPRASSSAWRLVARDVAIGGEIAPEREVGFASRTSAELVRSGERSVGEGPVRVDGVDGWAPRVGFDALGDLESHREGRRWSQPVRVKEGWALANGRPEKAAHHKTRFDLLHPDLECSYEYFMTIAVCRHLITMFLTVYVM